MKILNWNLFCEGLHDHPVSNIGIYNQRMEAAIVDKLFFLNKINFDVIVDFGCADGLLLEKISQLKSNVRLIGYEIDPEELSICKSRLGDKAFITDDWTQISRELDKFKSPILCLSSVIHEVYSYTDNESAIQRFWKERVFGGDFKYITIRDMIPSNSISHELNFSEDVEKVKSNFNLKYIGSFEEIWGKLESSYQQFVHFLLKYKYTNNWEREVNENYFPLKLNELKSKIPNQYSVVYEANFVLPYIQEQVSNDFNVTIKHPTHTKMILKNNQFQDETP